MKKLFLLIGCLTLTVACQSATPTLTPESAPTETPQPTPIPATTTPTFPPAATTTPFPLYFTDEFDSNSTTWQFLQTGGAGSPTTTFENGTLRIDIPSADTWYIGVNNAHTYSNILISTKLTASSTGSAGLICRYNETDGWYEFNVDSNGNYSVLHGQWLTPGIAKFIPITTDRSNQLNTGNINYEISLSCQDNLLNLYINNNLIRRLDVTNYGLSEGNIGITAASFKEAPITTFFEWLKVEE